MRLAVLSMIGVLAILGVRAEAASAQVVDGPAAQVSADELAARTPVPEWAGIRTGQAAPTTTSEPERPGAEPDQEPTTTSGPAPTGTAPGQGSTTTSEPASPGTGPDQGPTTTSEAERPGVSVDQEPTTTSVPQEPEVTGEQGTTTTTTTAAVVAKDPVRPGASPQVRDSPIPLGSIALALIVLASVGGVSYVFLRGRPGDPESDEAAPPATRTGGAMPSAEAALGRSVRDRTAGDASTSVFLIGLGEALMDAGAAVGHVESALRAVARAIGSPGIGVIVLPTALIVSVPNGDDLITEIGAPGRAQLRLDQIDDVLSLVGDAEAGAIRAGEGRRRLAEIRSAAAPYSPRLVLVGHILCAMGLAAILFATWVEIFLAALFGAVVGAFRVWTRRLDPSYRPFVVLVAATAVSTAVFALTRVVDDLLTFPLLIAPLTTFLPGGLLTIAVLELATGQIVSGASRLASGGLQLILLALGIVAGSQLVGVPARGLGANAHGTVAVLTPWIGVAVFGIGLVWFHGARGSARVWILLVMYVAYAGQVLGGLFFGSALSAFFGALAMTPVAVLVARRPSAPAPLVTILPGFWLLVPGALGLEGVTRLVGAGGAAATGVLVTTATSMVGVSLGILLGLLLVASDPARPWSGRRVDDPFRPSAKRRTKGDVEAGS